LSTFSSYSLTSFYFTDTATTEIYTLSLHDALPIYGYQTAGDTKMNESPENKKQTASPATGHNEKRNARTTIVAVVAVVGVAVLRSEEHTSELQSRGHLVCRLLLEKKKKKKKHNLQR